MGESAGSNRVLLLGVGPVPPDNPPRLHAPGLRVWTFAEFLAEQKYEVLLGMVGFAGADDQETLTDQAGEDGPLAENLPHGILRFRLPYDIEKAARAVQGIVARYKPRCVVTTTDFMNLVAVTARLPLPVWADYMGQPMAERQLQADVYGSDEGLISQWEYMLPVLLGADRLSVCSNWQRYMMLGELGAVGRLNRFTTRTDLVSVLVPYHLSRKKFRHTHNVLRGICVRADDFVILWSGGYNTWTDVDTLFLGLENAMAQHSKLVFVSTGGAIPGHDERTFERFRQMVEGSEHRSRYEFCGWVPSREVQNYYLESNAAINIDRWTVEGQVGYRTRILDWIMAGLPVLTTVLCELTEELAAKNFLTTFRIGDPRDLGIKLAGLANNCAEAMERTRQAGEYIAEHLVTDKTLAPLAEWVANPLPSPDLPPPETRPDDPVWCPENSLARLQRSAIRSDPKDKRLWARLIGRLS